MSTSSGPLVVFAGGGTGGHLYPALAVADELRRLIPGLQFAFYGSQRFIDQKILGARDATLVQQPLAPLSGKPWRWPGILRSLSRARAVCRREFSRQRPLVVVGTGGLASVPAVLEAVRAGIPTALINPDVIPGKANKFLASRVDVVFAQFAESVDFLSRRAHVEVSGCPVRPQFLTAKLEHGIQRFKLDPARKTLLVTGASQGARTINDALLANGAFLASQDEWQVLHLTGDADYSRVQDGYQGCGVPAVVLAYTEHMAEALAAADLVISRAGASTLAELTAVGRAALLLPYPFHRDQHQAVNARSLVTCGAALVLEDRVQVRHNAPALRSALEPLMKNPRRIVEMGDAARGMGRPHAAAHMAAKLLEMTVMRSSARHVESLEQSCSLAR